MGSAVGRRIPGVRSVRRGVRVRRMGSIIRSVCRGIYKSCLGIWEVPYFLDNCIVSIA
jgi:hypothetical protein